MQSLTPLIVSDLLTKVTEPLIKLEFFPGVFEPYYDWSKYGEEKYGEGIYGGGWLNIEDLAEIDGDCLQTLSLSISGSSVSSKPIATTWEAVVFNQEALFFPAHPSSDYKTIFKMGRKIRLHIGIKVSDTDYFWQQIIGVMSRPRFEGKLYEIYISGFDYTQTLTDTKLRSPDNYWGDLSEQTTENEKLEYGMPGACTGIYYAVWDGTPIFNGNDWTYNSDTNKFVFNEGTTVVADKDLNIYYFIEQDPEKVVADLLVTAGLYGNQAAALTAMEYDEPDFKIDRVWFNAGNSVLHAIKLLSERCNYRFHFKYDGVPVFKPKPSAKAAGSEDLALTKNQIAEYNYYEDDSEVFNRIVIEGEEQASPIWKENAEPNKLKGSASDSDSIQEIGEKTLSIAGDQSNQLFQDQTTIDNMCDTLLAEFKDPKKYISFRLEFSPIPLEIWDTVRIQVRITQASGYGGMYSTFKYGDGTKYGDNGIVIVQRGLVRDIKIDRFSSQIILEEVT